MLAKLALASTLAAQALAACENADGSAAFTTEDTCHAATDADGAACSWCTAGAVPASCHNATMAAKLPSSVFKCDNLETEMTFEAYLAEHGKVYENEMEYAERERLFEASRAKVAAHNADPSQSWKMGMTKFADMSEEEFKAFKGYNKRMIAAARLASADLPRVNLDHIRMEDLPESRDWRTEGVVSDVKDQGGCGSCWAFSGTESIESHVAIASGTLLTLAPQEFVDCAPNPDHCGGSGGCEGSTHELLFDYAKTAGASLEKDYPYTARDGSCHMAALGDGTVTPVANITGYVKIEENSYDDLMKAIATVGPVSITVDASWGLYSSGVFDGCSADADLDHGVQLVGYGTDSGKDYWIVRNSWGSSWGESGFIRLARSDSDATNCGTDSTPADGTACDGETDPVKVCGECGILYDTSYPTGATLL